MTAEAVPVEPDRVSAGGQVWEAAVDADPFGAWIGWELAVATGQGRIPDPRRSS